MPDDRLSEEVPDLDALEIAGRRIRTAEGYASWARRAIPALVKELREAREEVERMRAAQKQWRKWAFDAGRTAQDKSEAMLSRPDLPASAAPHARADAIFEAIARMDFYLPRRALSQSGTEEKGETRP